MQYIYKLLDLSVQRGVLGEGPPLTPNSLTTRTTKSLISKFMQ